MYQSPSVLPSYPVMYQLQGGEASELRLQKASLPYKMPLQEML